MKIAILTTGGAHPERTVPCLAWLVGELTACGDEVHIFAMCQGAVDSWRLHGATVHNAGTGRALRLFRLLWREQRRSRFDVVHSFWSVWAHLVAAMARIFLGVPMLFYVGGGELSALRDIGYGGQRDLRSRTLLALAMRIADGLAGQSMPVVRQFRSRGMAAERFALGVDLKVWPVAAPRPRGEVLQLLHVATAIPVKDHEMMLSAASRLKQMGVRFHVQMLGADVGGNAWVQQRIAAMALSDCMSWHGAIPHPQARSFFDQADILVVTSRFEAGALVVMEAALAGIAIVGTDVGHLAEWAPGAATVVAPRDHEGLAEILARIDADDAMRLQLARAGQARALAETSDITTAAFRQTYQRLRDMGRASAR